MDFAERVQKVFDNFDPMFDTLQILVMAAAVFAVILFARKRNAVLLPLYMTLYVAALALVTAYRERVPALYSVLSNLTSALIVVILVLFASDVKRLVLKLLRGRGSMLSDDHGLNSAELVTVVSEIIRAVQNMAKKNTGALIIIAPGHIQSQILESGTQLDSLVSAPLLESIFNTKAPMHDGAVILRGNRAVAAGCFLPLTQNADLPREFGTRHRAALGISEMADVVAIVVSEETGIISVCFNGKISRYYDSAMLQDTLEQVYGLKLNAPRKKKHGWKKDKKSAAPGDAP